MLTLNPLHHAASLRKTAAGLTSTIQAKRNPAIAQQRLTRRRANIADGMAREADYLARIQRLLYALAEQAERGTLDPLLLKLRTRTQIEELLWRDTMPDPGRSPNAFKRLALCGLDAVSFPFAKQALLALDTPASENDQRAKHIRELERNLIGLKIPGYFPTPPDVVARMIELANLKPYTQTILEPSAGKGNIADMLVQYSQHLVHVIEINPTLREILAAKGHRLVGDDFLSYRVPDIDPLYDRILMNPPFENGQDTIHIQHAYDLLGDGGRLVSVMCEGTFFRTDCKSIEFREWLASWRLGRTPAQGLVR